MGAIRRSRTTRPKLRKYRLTERDLRILRAVGKMVYATTDLLTALFFGDPSVCSRRTAKLLALGLLAVVVQNLAGPNIYRLTRAGLRVLEEADVDPAELHLGSPARPDLGHVLLANRIRVALVVAAREQPEVAIDLLLADVDLRREWATGSDQPPPYIPDLLVRATTPTGDLGLVVEADTATESPSYFAKRKVEVLQALAQARAPVWGLTPWRPVVVAASARRLRSLVRPLVDAGGGALWLGVELDVLRERGALAPVAATFDEIQATPRAESLTYVHTLREPAPKVP